MGQWIGQAGLERQYEQLLGGVPGKRYLEIDAWPAASALAARRHGVPPVPGRDLHLHLDLDLQEYIGEIFPTDHRRHRRHRSADGRRPGVLQLIPATTRTRGSAGSPPPTTPCSTIRRSRCWTASSGAVSPLRRPGSSPSPAWPSTSARSVPRSTCRRPAPAASSTAAARCWNPSGHGRQNLIEAIKNSCNVYFYQVGVRIGLQRFLEHGTRLGFGERTGIDVPHEIARNGPISTGGRASVATAERQ
jgi:penicillin-binding protein 2